VILLVDSWDENTLRDPLVVDTVSAGLIFGTGKEFATHTSHPDLAMSTVFSPLSMPSLFRFYHVICFGAIVTICF
jgi:hypothetical protein